MRDWLERLAWGQPAVLDCGRDADQPGVLRLDAALHPIEIAILELQQALQQVLTDEPRFFVHQRRHSK